MCLCARDQKGHFDLNVEDGLNKVELRTEAGRPVRRVRQSMDVRMERRKWISEMLRRQKEISRFG